MEKKNLENKFVHSITQPANTNYHSITYIKRPVSNFGCVVVVVVQP